MDAYHLTPELQSARNSTAADFFSAAFRRNLGLICQGEQEQLQRSTVAIAGLGGVGGVHLVTLIRTGIGGFHIADFDRFEVSNINRQYGAKAATAGKAKLEAMKEEALSINPFLRLQEFSDGVNESDIDQFLDGVDLVIDGLDIFAIKVRRLLFNRAREKGIPVITAGPIGFSSVILVFLPDSGLTFDEYFDIGEQTSEVDMNLLFWRGVAPRTDYLEYVDLSYYDPEARVGPSLGLACQLCAGMAATETVRLLLKRGSVKCAPHYYQFDPYRRQWIKGYLPWGNRNPLQRLKFKMLKRMLSRKPRRSIKPPPCPVSGDNFLTRARFLIEAGIQAPSGDNCQPWQFTVGEDRIDLLLNTQADQSPFNSGQFASTVACGAALENMRIAGARLGWEFEARLLPEAPESNCLAQIRLPQTRSADCAKGDALLFDAIWRRTTNRRMFAKRPLLPVMKEKLLESVTAADGATMHLIEGEQLLRELNRIICSVDRMRVADQKMHEHLYSMLRFQEQEIEQTMNGLPVDTLEVGKSGNCFLRATRPWRVMKALNSIGAGRVFSKIASRGMLHCTGAVLITVPTLNTVDCLRGGQAMQRLWLTLTHLGLYAQPMAALPIFRNHWNQFGEASFQKSDAMRLPDVWGRYQALFPDANMETERQIMLFRIGYDNPMALARTKRKSLDAVCKFEI